MAIDVLKPGLSTTVQDLGRTGYYHLGIPPSGAADQYAARAANLLVGNDEGTAVLECTYMGPELAFRRAAWIAVTGAGLAPKVNGDDRPQWEQFPVKSGDVLSFGFITAGARAMIAVSGGIRVPVIMGSRSTYTLGGFGGHEGRALVAGDVLPLGPHGKGDGGAVSVPDDLRDRHPKELEIRVMPSLYDHLLTENAKQTFFGTDWTLTPVANRTGFRYQGPALEFRKREQPFGAGSDPSNITDTPYPVGSIQVPGGIEPILLHRDAVTGGGYAVIATVISADMDRVAQSAPNSKTRFVQVDMATALAARKDTHARLAHLRAALTG
ncbi:MAG: biotin-dependent carboxyltransferase [Rhodospirillales bacterium]|nr:biotin-dependent carboxyltransferase [Rhodospirillales bacterium]